MSDTHLLAAVERDNRIQPVLIKGYAGSSGQVSTLRVNGMDYGFSRSGVLYSSAEVLSGVDAFNDRGGLFGHRYTTFTGPERSDHSLVNVLLETSTLFSFHNHVEIVD